MSFHPKMAYDATFQKSTRTLAEPGEPFEVTRGDFGIGLGRLAHGRGARGDFLDGSVAGQRSSGGLFFSGEIGHSSSCSSS